MSPATGRRWAVLTAAAGTVFIAAVAFWLSFTALADLARRSGIGAGQAWAWPLIVDGIIVVATVAAVAQAGQRTAWYPWALLIGGAVVSVAANAIHAIVAADADVPRLLAASVAAVPPVVLLAITHLTVVLTHQPTPSDLIVFESEPVHQQNNAAPVTISTPGPAQTIGALDGPVPGRRERAALLRGEGWSNKRIARELAVHPSTVGRWFGPAHPINHTGHLTDNAGAAPAAVEGEAP